MRDNRSSVEQHSSLGVHSDATTSLLNNSLRDIQQIREQSASSHEMCGVGAIRFSLEH